MYVFRMQNLIVFTVSTVSTYSSLLVYFQKFNSFPIVNDFKSTVYKKE